MKIEIFGSGCPNCKTLEKQVREVLEKEKINAEIIKVTEIKSMIERGVMSTPALFINEEEKSSGRIPSKEEIKKWIK